LLLFGAVAARRWRLRGAAAVALLAAIAGLVAGVLAPADVWVLPMYTGLQNELLLLLAWALFAAFARSVGLLRIPGPPVVVAVVLGALLGEIPAAAILSLAAKDKSAAARLALAAAGGGLIGRLGDPAMLLMGARQPQIVLTLAPLGLICAVLAWPKRGDLVAGGVNGGLGGLGRCLLLSIVGIAALFPTFTLPALVLGTVALAIVSKHRRGPIDLAAVAWSIVGLFLVLIAIAGGAPEHAARGIELVAEPLGAWFLPLITAAAAILSALTDGTAASLLCVSVMDRALSLRVEGTWAALAAGVAVGGLGPLIAAGALRQGSLRWLAQLVAAVVYVAVFV
jgi:hypothetical protein